MTNYELEQEILRLKGVINRELDIILSRVKISKEEKPKIEPVKKVVKHSNESEWTEMGDKTNFPTIVM